MNILSYLYLIVILVKQLFVFLTVEFFPVFVKVNIYLLKTDGEILFTLLKSYNVLH